MSHDSSVFGGNESSVNPSTAFRVSEFEWEVKDRLFPPCEELVDWKAGLTCSSRRRAIRFVQANNGKKLVCENGHNDFFEGKPFIPADEFGPHGMFSNVLPRELQPTDAEIKATRWKIPKESKRRLEDAACCAKCGAPPFPLYQTEDPTVLWQWITEHDADLLSEIQRDLRGKPGAEMREWFFHISQPLRTKIIRRINMSPLHLDHGVPRKVADANWHLLSRASRRFLQRNFIFALCKKCNGSKSSKLFDRNELVGMWVASYYDESIAAAKHDTARWSLLEATLDVIYEQRKVG